MMTKFIVALEAGGLMEMPHFEYSAAQVIEAETPEEAVDIYNKKNGCNYFYGCVIGYYLEGKIKHTQRFLDETSRRMGVKLNVTND